jgi:hypothetical protein
MGCGTIVAYFAGCIIAIIVLAVMLFAVVRLVHFFWYM